MACSRRIRQLLAASAFITLLLLVASPVLADLGLPQLREQQREVQELERQQRLRRLSRPDVNTPPEAPSPTPRSDHCWSVTGLRLAGNTLIDDEALNGLLDPLLHPCMSEAQINSLLSAITALYLQQGYLASRPYLANPPQAGTSLDILIVEGFVESVEFEDPDLPLSLRRAFPDLLGRPLTLRALEQGLNQMNRLQSVDLSADLEPGTLQGGTRVVIRSKSQRASRWRTIAGLNNQGSALTGREQLALGLTFDSPLEQNDLLQLRGRRGVSGGPGESSSHGLSYSIPHGLWSLGISADRLEYVAPLPGSTLVSSGRSDFYSLGIERALWHRPFADLSASLQLSHKRVSNRIARSPLNLQSPTLTTLDVGLNLSWRDAALWNLSVGYSQGLALLGADTQTINPRMPEPQFRKYRAGLWQRREGYAARLPWRWDSELNLQYSADPLPAVEQIAVGDGSAVRGFRDSTVSGASGAVWRNTLSVPLGTSLPLEIRPSIGLDTGWSRFDQGRPWQRLSGASAGLQLSLPGGQLSLEYQRPLHSSSTPRRNLEPGHWRGQLTLVF